MQKFCSVPVQNYKQISEFTCEMSYFIIFRWGKVSFARQKFIISNISSVYSLSSCFTNKTAKDNLLNHVAYPLLMMVCSNVITRATKFLSLKLLLFFFHLAMLRVISFLMLPTTVSFFHVSGLCPC